MNSETEENYLKAIFKIAENADGKVSTNSIAEKLNTKASSVTDMIKKLADKQLIAYEKYQGVKLTEKGEKIAIQIIRKHRLWEYFLVTTLNFKWDEVHEIAEELEHINSDALIDKLDSFLGFPEHDPHGDPIPNKDGLFNKHKSLPLATFLEGDKLLITGVIDHSATFLQYLAAMGLELGSSLQIKQIISFDKSFMIIVNNEKQIFVSYQVAKNLLVVSL
jgi:DtxR family Mn-dependent transcriptional regulator